MLPRFCARHRRTVGSCFVRKSTTSTPCLAPQWWRRVCQKLERELPSAVSSVGHACGRWVLSYEGSCRASTVGQRHGATGNLSQDCRQRSRTRSPMTCVRLTWNIACTALLSPSCANGTYRHRARLNSVVWRECLNTPGKPKHGPDRTAALAQYRRRAGFYDLELALFEPIRHKAISRLALKRGDVVLDVGCGTGLSLELVRQGIGIKGKIIGIEQSPEMIEKARERVAQDHWNNVTLLCSPVETADIPGLADAALFHFTHDILRRPEAVANVIRHLKPGA